MVRSRKYRDAAVDPRSVHLVVANSDSLLQKEWIVVEKYDK